MDKFSFVKYKIYIGYYLLYNCIDGKFYSVAKNVAKSYNVTKNYTRQKNDVKSKFKPLIMKYGGLMKN